MTKDLDRTMGRGLYSQQSLCQHAALKCCTVGDVAVGKTSMLIGYSQGTFSPEHVPTVLENYNGKFR